MPGRGPMPKDPRDRARRNSDIVPHRVIESDPVSQPPLPARMPNGEDWPARPAAFPHWSARSPR